MTDHSSSRPQPIVLITGASRGIGAATAKQAAAAGYAVAINYRVQADSANRLVDELRGLGAQAIAVQSDISVEKDVIAMFARIDAELGCLTALVNNAAILERQTTVLEMDAARINRVMQTNVTGSFLCAREAVRRMSTSAGGSGGAIVNVSSVASRLGSPGEYVDYAASKGAIDSLTIGLAGEVAAEGIRVNAVRPGVIYTDMHASGGEPGRVDRIGPTLPLGRGGHAEEVANAILWLLSDQASYTTGSFIEVAGGR
jgi:NAD(P)-dependent dehydrogenase (short-subunit alcohol dehydrogenase family)